MPNAYMPRWFSRRLLWFVVCVGVVVMGGCTLGLAPRSDDPSTVFQTDWRVQYQYIRERVAAIDTEARLVGVLAEDFDDAQTIEDRFLVLYYLRPDGNFIEATVQDARPYETYNLSPAEPDAAWPPMAVPRILSDTERVAWQQIADSLQLSPTELIQRTLPAVREVFQRPFTLRSMYIWRSERVETQFQVPGAWFLRYTTTRDETDLILWVHPNTGAILYQTQAPADTLDESSAFPE